MNVSTIWDMPVTDKELNMMYGVDPEFHYDDDQDFGRLVSQWMLLTPQKGLKALREYMHNGNHGKNFSQLDFDLVDVSDDLPDALGSVWGI